jgi:formylglycine-generating enzyme required for sulfatase activity
VVSDRLETPLQASITGPSATDATAPSTDARLNNSLQMALVYVPAGRFVMGSPASEQGRVGTEHAHEVVISQGFYLGVHEVTQSEFQQVMGANPSQPSAGRRGADAANPDTARLPIESVLWSEAVEFCRRLSERTEERAAGRSYRLPTEAQWEYACRAGSNAAYSIGDRLTSADANFKAAGLTSATLRTMQVGSFPPNRWGLHDMHGNVEEWCLDYYDYGYHRNSPLSDPSGPAAGLNRVSRGGSYLDSAEECRSARRMGRYPGSRAVNCGFRVVCEVK